MASEKEPISSNGTALGLKLRAFCDRHGSVRTVADALKITPQQLQKYVRGAQKPGAEILAGLKRNGCDINWLLDEEKPIGSIGDGIPDAPCYQQDRKPTPFINFDAAEFVLGCPLESVAVNFDATPAEVRSWREGATPPLDKLVRLTNLILFKATDGRIQIRELEPSSSDPADGDKTKAA